MSQVPVQMMNMKMNYDIYQDQGLSVLHLPFNNSYSMLLLLPADMATLENAISSGHVTKWLERKMSRFGESKIILKFLFFFNMEGLTLQTTQLCSVRSITPSVYFPIFLGCLTYIFQSSPSRLPAH